MPIKTGTKKPKAFNPDQGIIKGYYIGLDADYSILIMDGSNPRRRIQYGDPCTCHAVKKKETQAFEESILLIHFDWSEWVYECPFHLFTDEKPAPLPNGHSVSETVYFTGTGWAAHNQ